MSKKNKSVKKYDTDAAVRMDTDLEAFYTVGSNRVFGIRDDKTITGIVMSDGGRQQAVRTTDIFADYLKRCNIGDLSTVEVGVNVEIITTELSRREVLDFKMLRMEFQEAVETANDYLVNDTFDRLRGK